MLLEEVHIMDYYIHQIGGINEEKTYKRLISILKLRAIASRSYLEEKGIEFSEFSSPFILKIPKGDEWMYYDDDIHKDRVSLSDPQNRFIRTAIRIKDSQSLTCFDYNYIALAVSREVPIIPREQTKGLAYGEVQVKDKIDLEYVVGLILPISQEQLLDENIMLIVNKISELCTQNNFPLNIYNYEGELLLEKRKSNTK